MTLKHTKRRDLLHDANPTAHGLGLASEAGAGGLTELHRLRREVAQSDLTFDYAQIELACRQQVITAALDIKAHGRRAQESLLAIGQRLLDVKALLPHGQFSAWLTQEFSFTQRTAQNFMNVAVRFQDKSETVSLFGDAALYLLSAPSTPATAITAAIDAATAADTPLTKRQVQAIIRTHQAPAPPPVATTDTVALIWQAVERNGGNSDALRLAWLVTIDSPSLNELLPITTPIVADVLTAARAQVLTALCERLSATLAYRNAARTAASASCSKPSGQQPAGPLHPLSLELTYITGRIQAAATLAKQLHINPARLADCLRLIHEIQEEIKITITLPDP